MKIPAHLPPRPSRPAGLAVLRSPKVLVGGVLLLVLATACACGSMDDDDCDSMGTTDSVFAAGSSGVRMAPPAQTQSDALPASGGFGTHLASCGG
ncbi:hypothetical protein Rhe02_67930 [Rhizocola hellebori]|uniref:Uncharacterized protein n=1 Tax=Rhizocola hellebori TaxID=1392758 RepID=A0A8J3VK46_9ACTN|nr:hypothetical protein [Rhizocola hellebori]GIH08726.1 hypothetical protein Rhe02_67930 [Rhizocola hellebori]